MRATILVLILGVMFSACKKDKYTSAPQIKYKSLTSNFYDNAAQFAPSIVFSITDAEGDLGDTSLIHIKNILTGDSLEVGFPNLDGATKKDLKADVTVSVGRLQGCAGTNPPGHVDTMYYEIYVVDFAKNRSNTIVTGDPIYQVCQ